MGDGPGEGAGSFGIESDPLCLHNDRGEIRGRCWPGIGMAMGVLVGGEVSCESMFGGEVGGGGMGLVTMVVCGYSSAGKGIIFVSSVETTRYDAKISMLRDTVLE